MPRTSRAALTAVAVVAALLSSPSVALAEDPVPDPPPAPVSALTVSGTADTVTLAWTLPADEDLTRVVVRRNLNSTTPPETPTSGQEVASGLLTTWTDTGLIGTEFRSYAVFAQDAAGQWSTAVGTSSLAPSSLPFLLTPTVDLSSITLAWTAPTDAHVAGFRARTLSCTTPRTVLEVTELPRTATSFVVDGLGRSEQRCLSVQQVAADGRGMGVAYATAPRTWAVAPVSDLAATPEGSTALRVGWTLPDDPEVAAVVVTRSGTSEVVYQGTATGFVDTGLPTEHPYTYTVRTRTDAGASSIARTVRTRTALEWHTPGAAPFHGEPGALDCPRSTWCMELDRSGQWQVLAGSTWSSPSPLPDSGHDVYWRLSCPEVGWCLARSEDGFRVFSGGRWSAPTATPQPRYGGYQALTCVSRSWCLAVSGDSHWTVFTGSSWSEPAWVGGLRTVEFWDVSCQARGRCFAVGQSPTGRTGYRATLSNGAWSTATLTGAPVPAIDCPTSTTCLAAGDGGTWTVSGTRWTHVADAYPPQYLLSCATATSCLSTNDDRSVRWNGRVWTTTSATLVRSPGRPTALACPRGSSVCHAVDDRGLHYRWTASTGWRYQSVFDDTTGFLGKPACVSDVSCVAVDHNGWLFIYGGATWRRAEHRFSMSTELSCTSGGFCLAVQADGRTRAARHGSWGSFAAAPTRDRLGRPSCVGPSTCLSVDVTGRAWRFDGTRWHPAGTPFVGLSWGEGPRVSCTSTGFCMAVTYAGQYSVWNGTGWSKAGRLPSALAGYGDMAFDCSSRTHCLVVNDAGATAVWSGSSWRVGSTGGSPGYRLSDVDCVRNDWCLAVHPYSNSDRPAVWNGTSWADGGTFGAELFSLFVTCPTTTTCLVSGDQRVAVTGPDPGSAGPADLTTTGTTRTWPATVR